MDDDLVYFHPDAEAEFIAAFQWYWDRNPRTADAFDDAVLNGINLVQRDPSVWPLYVHGTRKYVLRKFPYNIVYRETNNRIEIVALANQHRRPGYWAGRVN